MPRSDAGAMCADPQCFLVRSHPHTTDAHMSHSFWVRAADVASEIVGYYVFTSEMRDYYRGHTTYLPQALKDYRMHGKDVPLTPTAAATPTASGIGPDAPKVTNEFGGQQSQLNFRFDLLDAKAMFALAGVLDYGVRERGYPANNWRRIPVNENLNHALMHIMAYMDGDVQDDHLVHAFVRMMFAVGVQLQGGPIVQPDAPTKRHIPID